MSENKSAKSSVLIMYETTSGLGHLRRASGIANALINEGADVMVASGTFMDPGHFFDRRVKIVELPPHHILKGGKWYYYDKTQNLVENPRFNQDQWKAQRAQVVLGAVAKNPVHAVLAEFWPFSRRREFTNIINALGSKNPRVNGGIKPLVFSSARDVLDTGSSMKKTASEIRQDQRHAADLIKTHVDHVLIHGDPRLVAFGDGFAFFDEIKGKSYYTGYVVNDDAKPTTSKKREDNVIVSVGSGSTGYDLMKSALMARPYTKFSGLNWVFIMGPRMESEGRAKFLRLAQEFQRSAKGSKMSELEIEEHFADLPALLTESRFSISLAGYNTTLEVLSSGISHVLVPKFKHRSGRDPWIDKEQLSRLQRLESQHMAHVVYPKSAMEPDVFAKALNEAFRGKTKSVQSLDTDGAKNTAIYVMKQIVHKSEGLDLAA